MEREGGAHACGVHGEQSAAAAAVGDCIATLAHACSGGSNVQVPAGGQKVLFCAALALVDTWPQGCASAEEAGQSCAAKACRACIEAFSGMALPLPESPYLTASTGVLVSVAQ